MAEIIIAKQRNGPEGHGPARVDQGGDSVRESGAPPAQPNTFRTPRLREDIRRRVGHSEAAVYRLDECPHFFTADEAAELLRTTRKGIYAMAERGLLPGVTRIGRRLLLRSDVLLHWLDQKAAPSPKE